VQPVPFSESCLKSSWQNGLSQTQETPTQTEFIPDLFGFAPVQGRKVVAAFPRSDRLVDEILDFASWTMSAICAGPTMSGDTHDYFTRCAQCRAAPGRNVIQPAHSLIVGGADGQTASRALPLAAHVIPALLRAVLA
jgi:hypothetical protein